MALARSKGHTAGRQVRLVSVEQQVLNARNENEECIH